VITLAVVGSLKVMEEIEQQWLVSDLERRSKLLLESTHDYLVESLSKRRQSSVGKLLNRLTKDERLTGALVCSTNGKTLAKSEALPEGLGCIQAGSSEVATGTSFRRVKGVRFHEAAFELRDDQEQLLGHLLLIHDTSYMSRRHDRARRYIIWLLVGLSLSFFVMTLAVYRWSRSDSVRKLKNVLRGLISGEARLDKSIVRSELSPLARDLSKVMRELRHA
jgi:trehalose 6-phosphate synthase